MEGEKHISCLLLDILDACFPGIGTEQSNIDEIQHTLGRITVAVDDLVQKIIRILLTPDGGHTAVKIHPFLAPGDVIPVYIGCNIEVSGAVGLLRLFAPLLQNCLVKKLQIHIIAHGHHVAGLLSSQKIAGTTNLQVTHGDLEAGAKLGKVPDGSQTLLCDLGQGFIRLVGEIGVGVAGGAAYPAPELVKLAQDQETEHIVFENGEGINRVTYYYAMVDDYIICITMITDGFFTEDTHKNHANSRMLDWFSKANTPSTDINAEGGGYYLNDIMAPSTESTIYYNRYCRDEEFHIAGETYYDGFSMNNGNSYGDGRITDAIFKFDGKTYSELTFTVGVRDEDIDAVTTPETNAALQILVDGKQVWEEEFYAFEKAKTYTLDITSAKKVVFRMDDKWELTGLCVADVIVSEQPRNIDTTIKPVEGTVDFLVGAIPYYTSASAKILDGSTSVNVAGKDYNKGMVLYNTWQYDSNTYFNLGGKYEQFNFSVGVIKDTLYANGGWLNIYLDGVKILDVELDYDHPKQDYSLDVSGGHILCIQGTAGIDYGFHQGDYALYNMTLGAPVVEPPEKVEPGSYKLLSEIDTPFSSKSVKVFDGSSKTHGAYMGDIFYNEGILLKSIYSFLGSPLDSALPAKANFYIGGNYKYLTFTAGRVDKSHVKNDVLVVLGDGVELARYNLAATDFPKSYEVNVEGVDVLQFQLLGDAMLLRGIYMVADVALHTHEIGEVDFYKPEQAPFPDTVDLMERFKPYEYMSAEGNGHDEIRFFNGIYDGSDSKKFFTIDGKNHTRGFVLSTHVYLSLDAGGLIGAGSFGIAGFVGGALALMALAASSEVSQASFACFNLQNQYKTMTFNVGVVDGQNENDKRAQPYDTLYVFADDKIVGEYKLTGDMSTMEITVDVANCERLTFWLDHNRDSYSYGIFDATLTK